MLAQENQRSLQRVIARAWSDPGFKERLKVNPKTVLAEMGINTPEAVDIEVVENTAAKAYLILPMAPLRKSLSDNEIMAASASVNGAALSSNLSQAWCCDTGTSKTSNYCCN